MSAETKIVLSFDLESLGAFEKLCQQTLQKCIDLGATARLPELPEVLCRIFTDSQVGEEVICRLEPSVEFLEFVKSVNSGAGENHG